MHFEAERDLLDLHRHICAIEDDGYEDLSNFGDDSTSDDDAFDY
jgi:hypothetical protein